MWGTSKTLWATFVIALMLLSSFVVAVGAPPDVEPNAPEEPIAYGDCYGGSSERTVVVEVFTATWCQYCPPQAYSNGRLYDELGHDNWVVLEHHASSSSLLYLPASSGRMTQYGATGYPTAVIDGGGYFRGDAPANGVNGATLWSSGGTQKWQYYNDNRNGYDREKARTSNLTISLTGNLTTTMGSVRAHIEATDPIPETNLKVKFMVYESNLYKPPHANGELYLHHRVYDHVVRAILADYTVPVSFDMPGDTLDVERTFSLDVAWDIRNLGVAVLVQTDNVIDFFYQPSSVWRHNYAILQAAAMDYVPTGLILVDGNDGDNMATDFDHYDELLTKLAVPHNNWDTHESVMLDTESDNHRTMPQFMDISEYPGVIWFTGSDTTTLSLASRNAIGTYLDERGNLLIIGEEIAMDAFMNGWDPWLETYLHATYVADNSGSNAVDGIAADPITDGMVGLGVVHSSPDVIATFASTEIFVYSPAGTDIAGIRADHDGDSRVIYDAFDYFEGTNTEDFNFDDETLMNNMIDWLDGTSPPDVDVLQPDGGEVIAKVTGYEIQWHAIDVEMPEFPVTIEYTTDSVSPVWVPIATGEPNDGYYLWTTPNVDSTKCRVRICAVDSVGGSNCVQSDADFTIGVPPPDVEPPEISSVLLDGLPTRTVSPGDVVELTAVVDDTNTGPSGIAGANYSIDSVWDDGNTMFATDGSFGDVVEDVNAFIDTTGWPDASYQICVHAWDDSSNYNTSFTACATLIVFTAPPDTIPPEIYNVLIDGQPTRTYFFSSKPVFFILDATIDDTNTGNSAIANASYTISPPAGSPSYPMVATDGMYDNSLEDVTAGGQMPGFPGYYQICVYASDSSANLNVTGACADLTIIDDVAPQVLNVLVNNSKSSTTPIGTPVYLNATISDADTGNSVIVSANYTDGYANWATSTPMFAVDGNYNTSVEDVTAYIDTSGWALGPHTICVYAEDSWSNYNLSGADCVQLDVLAFGPAPPLMLDAQLTGIGLVDVLVTWQASGDDGAGLDNVVEYEVYIGNVYTGPYNLDVTTPAADQPTYQYTCTNCGYGDTADYFFYVRAYNGMEYSATPNRAGKFVRHLTTGTQLASVPLVLSDTSIGTVLQTIQYDKVWTYDATDTVDPWKWYHDSKPHKGDLWNIDHTRSFWINVLVEDDLVVAGLVPVLTQIQLKGGWNLVSFPSLNPMYTVGQLKMDIGAQMVEGYDPAAPYCLTRLTDFDMITAGKGFWIYVNTDRVWDIIQ